MPAESDDTVVFPRLLYKIAIQEEVTNAENHARPARRMLAFQSAAQDYPSKPVHVFVPSSPGGASTSPRGCCAQARRGLGSRSSSRNRVASGGIVGTAQLAKSPADGYTIMITFDTFASNPHLYKELLYDVVKDFAPIMLMVRYPQILVVHPSLKVRQFPSSWLTQKPTARS